MNVTIVVTRHRITEEPEEIQRTQFVGVHIADALDEVRDEYLTGRRVELRPVPGKRFVNDDTVTPQELFVIEAVD